MLTADFCPRNRFSSAERRQNEPRTLSFPALRLIPLLLLPSRSEPRFGGKAANGHISCRPFPLRRLGGREVIPSLRLPSTSGIYHFISAVGEEGSGPVSLPRLHLSVSRLLLVSVNTNYQRQMNKHWTGWALLQGVGT